MLCKNCIEKLGKKITVAGPIRKCPGCGALKIMYWW